jgi:hypothetical protein
MSILHGKRRPKGLYYVPLIVAVMALVSSLDARTVLGAAQELSRGVDTRYATTKPIEFTLKIDMPEKKIRVTDITWLHATVSNRTGADLLFPRDRVHVVGDRDEPHTTLLQRQRTGTLNSGEPATRTGGFEPIIRSHSSSTRKYDLTKLYDLTHPGHYTVFVEVFDTASEIWVRSAPVEFEIVPASTTSETSPHWILADIHCASPELHAALVS